MNLEDLIKSLPPELQEKAEKCESVDALLALASEEKFELSEETLAAIAGGQGHNPQNCGKPKCPKCGSTNVELEDEEPDGSKWVRRYYRCKACGHRWNKRVFDP